MSETALVVMAAGIGRRYGGLKQIEPYGPSGEILLDYSVYDAMQSGFGKFIFVINREINRVFRDRIDNTIGLHCDVSYVFQELGDLPTGFRVPEDRKKPWGTGHAVLSCREVIDAPFAVINADDFYGRSAFKSLANHLNQAKTQNSLYNFCLVGYQLRNTLTEHGYVSRGICSVDEDGYLVEVRERTKIRAFNGNIKYCDNDQNWIEISENSIASMNIWGFTPNVFRALDQEFRQYLFENENRLSTVEFFLPEVINHLLQDNQAQVKVLPTKERWFGVTYQEDAENVKRALQKMVDEGRYPYNIWG